MDTFEIKIKADMDDMGIISSVIQSKKGDFLSIDQEGDYLVVIARIPYNEFNSVKDELKKLSDKDFKIEIFKR